MKFRVPSGLRRTGSRHPPQNQTYQPNKELLEHVFD
jgi:hypothetical protein